MIWEKKWLIPIVLTSIVVTFVLLGYSHEQTTSIVNTSKVRQEKSLKNKIKKQKKHYEKDAEIHAPHKSASTYLNYKGKLYVQSDSVYGNRVDRAIKKWNSKDAKKRILVSGTGQLTDLLISDVSVPYTGTIQPVLAVITNNHIALINATAVEHLKLNSEQKDTLINMILARSMGDYFENKKITLDDLNDFSYDKAVKKVSGNWANSYKEKSYSESLMSIKTDLGDTGIRLFEYYNAVYKDYSADKNLDLSGFNQEYSSFKDSLLSKRTKGVNAEKVSNAGYRINIELLNSFKNSNQNSNVLSKQRMDKLVSQEKTKSSSIVTIAGTKSTLGE